MFTRGLSHRKVKLRLVIKASGSTAFWSKRHYPGLSISLQASCYLPASHVNLCVPYPGLAHVYGQLPQFHDQEAVLPGSLILCHFWEPSLKDLFIIITLK